MVCREPWALLLWCMFIASALAGTPSPRTNCSAIQQLSLGPTNISSLSESLVNGTLPPGCEEIFWFAGDACDPSSYLMLELWDLEATGLSTSEAMASLVRAQPFLVVSRGTVPKGSYNSSSASWTFLPPNSLSDVAGQNLLRPYLQVQTQSESMTGSQAMLNNGACSSSSPCWYAMVLNSQMLMSRTLEYELRVSCSSTPQCASPLWGGSPEATETCSGNGRCQVSLVPPPLDVMCACNPGWGDIGCNQPLVQLGRGKVVADSVLPPGQWDYYEVMLPQGNTTLLVEMSRTRGDPILFLKGKDEGFQPGALPSTLDFTTYADKDSWRERSNSANLLRTDASPGPYYVGVLNNNDDIQEMANFSIMARWSDSSSFLCPQDCNNRGRCALSGFCICNNGFGGQYCEGTLADVQFSQTASGTLQPGNWAYYSVNLTDPDSRRNPLTVEFDNNAGQSIVLASFGNYPTLLDANFTFRASQAVGSISQVVQPSNMVPGILQFGIYNMDYYVHAAFQYNLMVYQSKPSKSSYTPWISVGVALGCSGIIGFAIFQGHRAYMRRRAGARGWAMWSWSSLPVFQPAVRRRRTERRRGLDPALVHAFPTYTHDASKLARGESQTPKTDVPSEDEKLCSVCLCEYEDGDLIRQLIPCRHDFHCKCIDQWLAKNSTCPMCRMSLVPEGYVPNIERESLGGGISVQPGERGTAHSAQDHAAIQLAQMEGGVHSHQREQEPTGGQNHPREEEACTVAAHPSRAHRSSRECVDCESQDGSQQQQQRKQIAGPATAAESHQHEQDLRENSINSGDKIETSQQPVYPQQVREPQSAAAMPDSSV